MTPSEMAESLLTKFYSAHGPNLPFQTSKECAIICVEQIIEANVKDGYGYGNIKNDYWYEVKTHIESM